MEKTVYILVFLHYKRTGIMFCHLQLIFHLTCNELQEIKSVENDRNILDAWMANIIYSAVYCLRCVFYASKLFFCVCKLRWASSSSFQFFTHTFSVPTFGNCIDWNKLKLDCVTYWLGFELREQKSILFILLPAKEK